MLANNISGWMCDFGESLPLDTLLFNGQSASEFHNTYSAAWGKLNAEAVQDAVKMKLLSAKQVFFEGYCYLTLMWLWLFIGIRNCILHAEW